MSTAVADTILAQLGGRRFIVMTGAKSFLAIDNALRFKLPSPAKDGSTLVQITLTPMDEYLFETFSVRGTDVHSCTRLDGVYADNLCEIFTSVTGLATRL